MSKKAVFFLLFFVFLMVVSIVATYFSQLKPKSYKPKAADVSGRIGGYVKDSKTNAGVVNVPVQVCDWKGMCYESTTGTNDANHTFGVTSLKTDTNGYYYIDNKINSGENYGYVGIWNLEPNGYAYGSAKTAKAVTDCSGAVQTVGQTDYRCLKSGVGDCGQNCDFTIDPAVKIAGHVKDSQTNTGVPNAYVHVCDFYINKICYVGDPVNYYNGKTGFHLNTNDASGMTSIRDSDGYKFVFNIPSLRTDNNGYYQFNNVFKVGDRYFWLSLFNQVSGYSIASAKTTKAFTDCDGVSQATGKSDYRECQRVGSGDCGENCDFTIDSTGSTNLTPTPTATPNPSSTLTPTATLTPVPTDSLTPSPTPTGNSVTLNIKLKFQGIGRQPQADLNKMKVKVTLAGGSLATPSSQMMDFTADSQGVWSGHGSFNAVSGSGYKYRVLIKGPKHIQKKICDSTPTETALGTYSCDDGNIVLTTGDNDLDFSGIYQLTGDLPGAGGQDGVVNANDVSLIVNNLGKTDTDTINTSDVNYDGVINAQDYSLVLSALSIKTDER